ncbi:MAG: ThiF family adenylyltransferase, partial [Blastocatellia bacterium]
MAKNKKNRNKHGGHPGVQRSAPPEVLLKLDMGFLNASVVSVHEWRHAQIVLVGCGGIGSFLAQHIARLLHVLCREPVGPGFRDEGERQKAGHLTLVDPDNVEEGNLGRQLFCAAELGLPKAQALANRYGQALGLNCSYYAGKYSDSLLLESDLTVIVGCVDNAEARRSLHETLQHNEGPMDPSIWWLDRGNLYDTGRVLLGSAYDSRGLRMAFLEENKCGALPSPAVQFPGLLKPEPEEIGDSTLSCRELAERNLQSLNINALVAVHAADMLSRLLLTRDLRRFQAEVNLAAGTSKSTYVTADEVSRVSGKPVSFLTTRPELGSLDA